MTNFEWLKQNDELLLKALECDRCDECVFNNLNGGCSVVARKEWLQETHQNFVPGDIIISKTSHAIYICTHIDDNIVYYDARPEMVENAKARYGCYKENIDDFDLYLKGTNND